MKKVPQFVKYLFFYEILLFSALSSLKLIEFILDKLFINLL